MSAPDLLELSGRGPIHFMGIGGAGMCALAEAVLLEGGQVTGCDLRDSPATKRLSSLGATISSGHEPGHAEGAAALVVTSAVPADHPELQAARDRGVPVLKRAYALGSLVNRGRVVAIAGTHGKTSTTALTVQVLEAAGLDPTGFVGGPVSAWSGNLRRGSSALYVVEADEYDRSFHSLEPDIAVVTNLESDHLDVYGDLAGVKKGFRGFLAAVRPGGQVIACADDPGASSLLAAIGSSVTTYGLSAGTALRAVDVRIGTDSTRFRIVEEGRDRGVARLAAPGLHAVRNALAAGAVARTLGASWEEVRRGWSDFRGVRRRFEDLGTAAGVRVVDDYAHHPTEIDVTLATAREAFPGRRLVAVFQPHLYSRTRDFAGDFGRSLAAADLVWVTDVFPARETPIEGVDGRLVAGAVRAAGGHVTYHASLDGLAEALVPELGDGDVVLTLGAGSVEYLGSALLRELGAVHA